MPKSKANISAKQGLQKLENKHEADLNHFSIAQSSSWHDYGKANEQAMKKVAISCWARKL